MGGQTRGLHPHSHHHTAPLHYHYPQHTSAYYPHHYLTPNTSRRYYSQADLIHTENSDSKHKLSDIFGSSIHLPTYYDDLFHNSYAYSSLDYDHSKYPHYISYSNPNYMYYDDDDHHPLYTSEGGSYSSKLGLYSRPALTKQQLNNDMRSTSILLSEALRGYMTPSPTIIDRHTHHHHQQQHVHQQQLLLKEEEELKAEERRRKIISDVVRDGTQNGLAGVSAGELLNKTHEELVLLLIQLRRQHSALQEARKQARTERDSQVIHRFDRCHCRHVISNLCHVYTPS